MHLQVKVCFQSLQNAAKDNKEEGDAGTGGDTSLHGISSLCDLLTSYAALNTKHQILLLFYSCIQKSDYNGSATP